MSAGARVTNEKICRCEKVCGSPQQKWGHASSFSMRRCAGTHAIRGGA
jgi:hypothetical protein